jgi:hypothetical protein
MYNHVLSRFLHEWYTSDHMKSVREYFEQNITSYNYLFFAGMVSGALKLHAGGIRSNPTVLSHSYPWAIWQTVYPTVFIILCLVGAWATYKTPDTLLARFSLWGLYLILSAFIVVIYII